MARPKYHRPFLFTSLLLISLGSLLGAAILANLCGWNSRENWTNYVSAHASTQVFGFVVLFTMGIAHQLLHQIYGRQHGPGWMYFSLATVLPGTVLLAFAKVPGGLGPLLQLAGALAFFGCMLGEHRATTKSHSMALPQLFPLLATGWLLVGLTAQLAGHSQTLALNLTIWGFAPLFIIGVGLRMHPAMLGQPTPSAAVQAGILILWNLGMLNFLSVPWPADLGFVGAAGLLHAGLRPLLPGRRPSRSPSWLRGYIRLAYAWLAVACLLRVGQDLGWQGPGVGGAAQHALASGFILTMMMGMGFRLVPSFERQELRSIHIPRLCLVLLGGSTVLRVAAQSLLGSVDAARSLAPWAGLGQASAVLLFALALLDVMLRGQAASSRDGLVATIQRTTVDVATT